MVAYCNSSDAYINGVVGNPSQCPKYEATTKFVTLQYDDWPSYLANPFFCWRYLNQDGSKSSEYNWIPSTSSACSTVNMVCSGFIISGQPSHWMFKQGTSAFNVLDFVIPGTPTARNFTIDLDKFRPEGNTSPLKCLVATIISKKTEDQSGAVISRATQVAFLVSNQNQQVLSITPSPSINFQKVLRIFVSLKKETDPSIGVPGTVIDSNTYANLSPRQTSYEISFWLGVNVIKLAATAPTAYGTSVRAINLKNPVLFETTADQPLTADWAQFVYRAEYKSNALNYSSIQLTIISIQQNVLAYLPSYDVLANTFAIDNSAYTVTVLDYSCVSGTFKLTFSVWHSHWPDYVLTHTPTIAVQNNCGNSLVKLFPAVPPNGWLKIAGNDYQTNMVIPYSTDFLFDNTKLNLTEPKCLAMSSDSKLQVYLEAMLYGDSAQTIFDSTKNPQMRGTLPEIIPRYNYGDLAILDPAFNFVTQTKLAVKLYAIYYTADAVLAAYRDPTMQINLDYNVFRIFPASTEEFVTILQASPDQPFSIEATTKFTTNMDTPSVYAAQYDKSLLQYTYSCKAPTAADQATDITKAASCCSKIFTWTNKRTLIKQNVSHLDVCDGLYEVTISAYNPFLPSYSEVYLARIRLKYDCSYLDTSGIFTQPLANSSMTIWRTGLNNASEIANDLSFKIGDADLYAAVKFWDSTHYQYSCSKKFEFNAPQTSSAFQYFSQVFAYGDSNAAALPSEYNYQGLLKVPKTSSHLAMEFNGTKIQVTGYLYSTEIIQDVKITSTGTQYIGETPLRTFTWQQTVIVFDNCKPSIIKVKEIAVDPLATVSSTKPGQVRINRFQIIDKTKLIQRIDLQDSWDSKYCLSKFDSFKLHSTTLSDDFALMAQLFLYVDPKRPDVNPTIQLVAEANQVVVTPTCQLSNLNHPAYVQQTCTIQLQIEAGIGALSFGNYINFNFYVFNECTGINTYQPPTNYDMWVHSSDPTAFKPFDYQIWYKATPETYIMPKLVPRLQSEFIVGKNYRTAAQECGTQIFYSITGDAKTVATLDTTTPLEFAKIMIQSIKPEDSGQTALTDFKRLFSIKFTAVLSNFPTYTIEYDLTKNPTQLPLEFNMQDRCLGMQFDFPLIKYNAFDQAGNKVPTSFNLALENSSKVKYNLKAPSQQWSMQRVTPYLYTAPSEPRMKADGKCGVVIYHPQNSSNSPGLVTWDPQQINPSDPSTTDLQFSVYSDNDIAPVSNFAFTVDINTASTQPLYPTTTFTTIIEIIPCIVSEVYQTSLAPSTYQILPVGHSSTRQDFMLISGGPSVDVEIPPLRQEPNCGYKWVYTLTTLATQDLNESVDFDSLILKYPKIEGTSPASLAALNQGKVTFKTDSIEIIGLTYATFITAQLMTSSVQTPIKRNLELARFKIGPPTRSVPKNTPPVIKNLVDFFAVEPGQNSLLQVGLLSDFESPKNITLTSFKVHCEDGKSDWLSLPPLGEILTQLQIGIIVPQELKNNTCSFQFTASDNDNKNPLQLTQKIIVSVSTLQSEVQEKNENSRPKTEEEIQEYEQMDDLLSRLYPQVKQSNKFINLPLILGLKQVSTSGVLTLVFNRPVQLNPDYFIAHYTNRCLQQQNTAEKFQINKILKNAFTVEFKANSLQFQSTLLDYTVLDFRKAQEIDIQLTFNEPLYVSFFAESTNSHSKDILLVSLKDAHIFIDPNVKKPIAPTMLQKEVITVPRQEAAEKTAVTQLTQVTTEAMVKVVVPSTIVVNILLGVSLKKLWSAVNLLQFVTYINHWRVSLPSNLDKLIKKASFFARGDWIPKEHIMQVLSVKPKSEDDKQALQTRFLIIILVGLAILLVLVVGAIYACKNYSARIVRFCQQTKQQIFWNGLIRYSLQSYLDFAISICLSVAIRDQTTRAKIGVYSCLLILLAVAPIGYFILLRKKFPQLRSQEMRVKIGTLYQGINTRNFYAVCYSVVFLARRMIFALITAFAGSFDGGLTVALVVTQLVIFSVYLIQIKPQETQAGNRIELASEILLTHFFFGMMVCLCTNEPKHQYFVAWIGVAAISILVLLCVGFLASDSVSKLVQWIKKKLAIQRRLTELERRNQEEIIARQQITEVRAVVQVIANQPEQQNDDRIQHRVRQQIVRNNRNDFYRGSTDPDPDSSSQSLAISHHESAIACVQQDEAQVDKTIRPEDDSVIELSQSYYDEEEPSESSESDESSESSESSENGESDESRTRKDKSESIQEDPNDSDQSSESCESKKIDERKAHGDVSASNSSNSDGNDEGESGDESQYSLSSNEESKDKQSGVSDLSHTPSALQPQAVNDKDIPSQTANNDINRPISDEDEIFVSSYGNEVLPEVLRTPIKEERPQQQLKDKFSWNELWVEDSATRSLNRRYFEAMDHMEKETIRIQQNLERFKSNNFQWPWPDQKDKL